MPEVTVAASATTCSIASSSSATRCSWWRSPRCSPPASLHLVQPDEGDLDDRRGQGPGLDGRGPGEMQQIRGEMKAQDNLRLLVLVGFAVIFALAVAGMASC